MAICQSSTIIIGCSPTDRLSRRPISISLLNAGICDGSLPPHRLSDGARHRPGAWRLAQHPAASGHPALLDLVPAARLCLDRASSPTTAGSIAALPSLYNHTLQFWSAAQHAIPMMNTEFRGHARHRLFLPAVHDPAALRQSRDASTSRSTRRRWISARKPWQVFKDVTLPLSMPGHHRRRAAGLHSGDRRTRHSQPGRARRQSDDRAGDQ